MSDEEHTGLTAGKDVPPWLQPVPEGEGEAAEASGRRKLLLTSVAAVVVIGLFSSVIWYIYDGADPGTPIHVAAPTSPMKERPTDVGGLRVEHQDKQVLNNAGESDMSSEVRLGEQPEQPLLELPADPVVEETDTSSDVIADVIDASSGARATVDTVVEQTAAVPVAAKPQLTVFKPAAKPTTSAAIEKIYRVQLGAYGTEASAERAWLAVEAKFPAQLDGKYSSYEAVKSGDRTLYRLRVGPIDTRPAADQVCLALRAGQQACIVVNP